MARTAASRITAEGWRILALAAPVLAALGLAQGAYAEPGAGGPAPEGDAFREWEGGAYMDVHREISFEAPGGWLIADGGGVREYSIVMLGPPEDGYSPRIEIRVHPRDGPEGGRSPADAGIDTITREGPGDYADARLGAYVVEGTGDGGPGPDGALLKYRSVTLTGRNNVYHLTYEDRESRFADGVAVFDGVAGSFRVGDVPYLGGGCLVATAAYGTELAPRVQALREARDGALLSTGAGTAFIGAFSSVYYSFSPAAADLGRQSPELRAAAAALSAPVLYGLSPMSLAEEGSEASVVALGAASVMLTLGTYAAAPAAAIAAGRRAARQWARRSVISGGAPRAALDGTGSKRQDPRGAPP